MALVAHSIPGRIRIKASSARGDARAMGEFHDALAALPGAINVETRLHTGSLIVQYDVRHMEDFLAASRTWLHSHNRRAGATVQGAEPKSVLSTAKALVPKRVDVQPGTNSRGFVAAADFLTSVDNEIRSASGDLIDLKIVLAVGLVGSTFWIIGANAATPMWVTMGLFGVTHFMETRYGAPAAGKAANTAATA